jgi:HEAT repeat protein
MSIAPVLVVMALAQVAFALGVVALGVVRRRTTRNLSNRGRAMRAVAEPVQRWLLGDGRVDDVAALLAALPPDVALEQLIALATSRARAPQRAELRGALREAPWVRAILKGASSRAWPRRRDAARLLAVVGTDRDRVLLQQLLDDAHPSVQGAATSCLPSVADRGVVAYVLDGLPERSMVVRLHQFSMLEETLRLTLPLLLERLAADAPPRMLKTWISLAETIGSVELLERVGTLHNHPDPLIRLSVARALRRYSHPDAEEVLLISLRDPDWRVRAVAARSLGALGDSSAVPRLAAGMRDVRWRVRFRCALALAQLGDEGRAALRESRLDTDRFAAEMATMISALSADSVAELADA